MNAAVALDFTVYAEAPITMSTSELRTAAAAQEHGTGKAGSGTCGKEVAKELQAMLRCSCALRMPRTTGLLVSALRFGIANQQSPR